MTSPEGLFYSALDADSEGEEGKFYVWNWHELMELPDGEEFANAFGCRAEGNFEDEATGHRSGANILHRSGSSRQDFSRQLAILLEKRSRRVRPSLDDKAVVGWNGLAIASLVEAGRADLAERTATAILDAERAAGRLPHLIANGAPSGIGFLDDYAYFCLGLISLDGPFKEEAVRLANEMVARFSDPSGPGLFFSTKEHEVLFGSTKPVLDQPLPSANAVAARVLGLLGRTEDAWEILDWAWGWMERAPHGTESFYTTALLLPARTNEPRNVPVQVSVSISGPTQGVVQLDVSSAHYVNANPASAAWLVPTEVKFEGVVGDVRYPETEGELYRGRIEIPFETKTPTDEFEIVVRYQACTDSECLAPVEVRFTMTPQRETR